MGKSMTISVNRVMLYGFCIDSRYGADFRGGPCCLLLWIWQLLCVIGCASLPGIVLAQSEIVMRDLNIQRSPVERFDESAIYLANGEIVDWDRVLRATLDKKKANAQSDSVRQANFDKLLISRGQPLFQIWHRLSVGDRPSLLQVVEPEYARLTKYPVDSAMARQQYIVALGAMQSRLYRGDREGAVLPFLRACQLKEDFDFETGLPVSVDLTPAQLSERMHSMVVPIFFDRQRAREQLNLRAARLALGVRTTGTVYWTALAICAGDKALIGQLLDELDDLDKTNSDWVKIFSAQLELVDKPGNPVQNLGERGWRERLTTGQSAVVDYLLATESGAIGVDADRATLAFLGIAAAHEMADRQLAAAALYQAALIAEKNGHPEEGKILKSELLDKYPQTYHGRMTKIGNQH